MICARCGRAIKNNNQYKIGNYFYGPTCAKKIKLAKVKIKSLDYEIDDKQKRLF